MKRASGKHFPEATLQEIREKLPKSATIHLRVTKAEKDEIVKTASRLRLTITEYLLKCHAVVEAKLR